MYNAKNTTPFLHEPLSNSERDVRLLKVEPGSADATIRCTLEHTQPVPNRYTCLSYEWGPEQPTREILVNGKTCTIRENLWQFLHTARRYGFMDHLWIDAICINQSDLKEKSSQVKRMGVIYRNSLQTVVWMGLCDEHVQNLLKLQQILGGIQPDTHDVSNEVWVRLCELLRKRRVEKQSDPDYSDVRLLMDQCWYMMYEIWGNPDQPCLQVQDRDFWQHFLPVDRALSTVAASTYWTRAWILQEVLLPHRLVMLTPTVDQDIEVRTLVYFLHSWFHHEGIEGSHPRDRLSGRQLQKEEIRTFYFVLRHDDGPRLVSSTATLDEAVRLSFKKGCTDIRDHIFSVMSMIRNGQRFPIDYTVSKERLFWQAVTFCSQEGTSDSDRGRTVMIIIQALGLLPPSQHELEDLEDLQKMYERCEMDGKLYWVRRNEKYLLNPDYEGVAFPAMVWPVQNGLRYVPWHSTWLGKTIPVLRQLQTSTG